MMKIMIVDNDSTYRGLLCEVLQMHGYAVTSACDGEDALSQMKQSAVDFILCDISMPNMNGIIFHRRVRQDPFLKHLPFAWNSGYRELRNAVELQDPRIDLNLDKSTPLPDLLSLLGHFSAQRDNISNEH